MGGRCRRRVGWREIGGIPDPRTRPDLRADCRVSAAQTKCGRDRIRTCVGNAGDFTGRTAVTPPVPSHPYLFSTIACDVHKQPVDNLRRPSASLLVPPRPARPSVGPREVGGKSRLLSDQSSTPTSSPRSLALQSSQSNWRDGDQWTPPGPPERPGNTTHTSCTPWRRGSWARPSNGPETTKQDATRVCRCQDPSG
jgi:hypothetical protein